MSIRIAQYAGFCFGVRRAYDTVISLSEKTDKPIYTVGKLIHNDIVVDKLKAKGIFPVDENEIDEILRTATRGSVFVIRTHGTTKEISDKLYSAADDCGYEIIDCTCPFVKKIHGIMKEHTSGDTVTFLYGDKNHPEVRGISSYIRGKQYIHAKSDELADDIAGGRIAVNASDKGIVASQTTQNSEYYKKYKKIIENLYTNPFFFDTICNVTENRQSEVDELSRECELMVIIGGRDSSNSRKLYDISKRNCDNTLFIESASDDRLTQIKMPQTAGIAAGASTPGEIIEEVYRTMSEQENFAQLLDESESFKTLNTGDTVKGIVTSVSNTEVKLDLGAKCTGVLTLENATDDPTAKLADLFKVGDEVEGVAVRVSDVDGIAVISKRKTDAAKEWNTVNAALESGEILEGKVVEAVKGGVVVSSHAQKVFIPASQTTIPKDGDLSVLVGTTQKFKVIDIKADRRRAVGSIKAVARDEKKAKEAEFWASVEEGKHYTGTVKSLTSYGAFVDLGGVDGMVHMSELSWLRIAKPSDVVAVGDTLDVFVKSFDQEKGRISLGYKTEESNPWTLFRAQYNVDDVAKVKIVSMMPFGAFAQIIPGVDGLIHISQIADKKLASPAEVLEKGQEGDAKLTDIDDENKKVSLSIRALLTPEEEAVEEPVAEEATETADAE
ncbi:MAG: bifunctional 4-hydroxy-3-methylbut-2-enyl diphosphate reductase/30S ribosomal protein S1 [Clostridia bacterium]|nr:bifunctional 4-hydroxy-3-methylbut-2-enyl diphosphate reductase/30S ribosomal protein S1 [Clostridia bacterium]